MEIDRRAKNLNRDYNILSSYLNRWVTVIVFSAIVALAFGAIYIKSDDAAHIPVVIGVSALDSTRAGPALESFAEFCRGKGCGDIRWRYLRPDAALKGCDFYITTSVSLSTPLARGSLGCALIAAEREAHRYSRSAVVVRAGVRSLPASGARVIFTSPRSASGFLAPYRSLERAGYAPSRGTIDFAGARPREERVVFGVLYGAYDAGGISLDRLQSMERSGILRRGELDVLCEGEALPEIVLAYDPARYTADRKSFVGRLPGLFDRSPRSLRRELAAVGMAGFYVPRADDIKLIERLRTMVPASCLPAAAVVGAARP
jgi:hypothetical protein